MYMCNNSFCHSAVNKINVYYMPEHKEHKFGPNFISSNKNICVIYTFNLGLDPVNVVPWWLNVYWQEKRNYSVYLNHIEARVEKFVSASDMIIVWKGGRQSQCDQGNENMKTIKWFISLIIQQPIEKS